MIVVDSSVWIDYFNGVASPYTDALDRLLAREPVALGDLILAEVLQGFREDRDYRQARDLLTTLPCFEMLGVAGALRSADAYRALRKRGITIRKTADAIIASFCIAEKHALLYTDRDFDPFVQHLGLQALPLAR